MIGHQKLILKTEMEKEKSNRKKRKRTEKGIDGVQKLPVSTKSFLKWPLGNSHARFSEIEYCQLK